MKPSFLLFVAFAISFVTTIAFTNPEILSFNSDNTTSGSDFDSIPKSFDVPREKMSKRVQSAPSLDVSGWENSRPLSIDSLKGKIVVLNFWTTWCGYCVDAIPHNKTLVQKYGNKDVVLIGVCTCLLYTSPSPRDATLSRMPSSA